MLCVCIDLTDCLPLSEITQKLWMNFRKIFEKRPWDTKQLDFAGDQNSDPSLIILHLTPFLFLAYWY